MCVPCAGKRGRPGGPWEECVVAVGFSGGACANCHYGGNSTRCSFRGKFILNI